MYILFFSNSFSTASQQFLPSFDSKPRLMSLLPGYHKIEGFVHTSKGQFVENSVVVSSSVSTRVRLGWGFWILRLFNVTAPSRFEVHRQFLGGRNHEGREYQPGAFSSRLSCVWVTAARHFAAIALWHWRSWASCNLLVLVVYSILRMYRLDVDQF